MKNFMETAGRWYEKAGECEDSYDQFISIWISFNAIYGNGEGSEFTKIKIIIRRLKEETIKEIINSDEANYFRTIDPPIKFLSIENQVFNTATQQRNLNRFINTRPKKALEELMFILNKVRNNLFHGDKRIEKSRDVEIVKNAYPIIRKIVQSNLNIDDYITTNNSNVVPEKTSLKINLNNTIQNMQAEVESLLLQYDYIPKDRNHPISLLLDRINMGANAMAPGEINSELMGTIRANLLNLYEKNIPDFIQGIEEVYGFVNKRMNEVIENGCTDTDMENFYNEYMDMQRKYLEKGYVMKT